MLFQLLSGPGWQAKKKNSNTIPCLGQVLTCLGQRQVKLHTLFRTARPKNHTLSSGTSPYSPNKGVPPPPGWSDYVSNEEVLRRTDAEDIEITLIKSRLRWLGHVSRMDDDRPVKALMYGELDKGTRPVGRPKLRYKDTCKSVLKSGRILDRWQDLVVDRPLWRRTIGNVCGIVNANRIATYQRQKEHRARKKAISGD